MPDIAVNRKILIVGVDDLFGEEIVAGLAVSGNNLLLCGDNEEKHLKLIDRYPNHVKGLCALHSKEHHKRVMAMIEFQGSLDAVIFLVKSSPVKSFLDQSTQDIQDVFNANMIEPIFIFKAIYPYLRKSGNCKVIFVDTNGFMNNVVQSSIHAASQVGLAGFCSALKQDLTPKGIDIRMISSPKQLHTRKLTHQVTNVSDSHSCSGIIVKILDVLKCAGEVTWPDPALPN